MKHLLWHLLAGTRGGDMRAKILVLLSSHPLNANQITKELGVDYKTIQHHLKVLVENKILLVQGSYGANYFISPETTNIWGELEEIWERIGNKHIKKKRSQKK